MKVSHRGNEQGFNLADPLTPSILDLSIQNTHTHIRLPTPFISNETDTPLTNVTLWDRQ
jgi:hypothetical protein